MNKKFFCTRIRIFICFVLVIFLQLPIKSLPAQDPSAPMQVDKKETSIVMKDETQIGGFAQAESIIIYTKVVPLYVSLPCMLIIYSG